MEQFIFSLSLLEFALISLYFFFFVLFFQSGLDKLMNWEEELKWIKSHFSKTIFKSFIPTLLFTLMLMEIITGLACLLSMINFFFPFYDFLPFFALFFSSGTLLFLFLGQRIAKDYQGAVSIAVYFGVNLIGLFLLFFYL